MQMQYSNSQDCELNHFAKTETNAFRFPVTRVFAGRMMSVLLLAGALEIGMQETQAVEVVA